MCSILLGNIAPIDYGDASGTNLFNIDTKEWDKKIMDAIDP